VKHASLILVLAPAHELLDLCPIQALVDLVQILLSLEHGGVHRFLPLLRMRWGSFRYPLDKLGHTVKVLEHALSFLVAIDLGLFPEDLEGVLKAIEFLNEVSVREAKEVLGAVFEDLHQSVFNLESLLECFVVSEIFAVDEERAGFSCKSARRRVVRQSQVGSTVDLRKAIFLLYMVSVQLP
jgi:hypothetical protein